VPSTLKRPFDHQPLHCSAEHHLWHHGAALAIYSKAGALTVPKKEGEPRKHFYCTQPTLAKFLGGHTNTAHNAMNFLRKNGWLVPAGQEDHYNWVNHADWARAHEGKCIERKIVPAEAA